METEWRWRLRTSFDVDLNLGSKPGQARTETIISFCISVSLCRVSELHGGGGVP